MNKRVNIPKRLTSIDIANHFQVSKATVLLWVKDGKLNGYQLPSKHLRFVKDDVNAFARKYNMPEME